jgi:hypothetical protein
VQRQDSRVLAAMSVVAVVEAADVRVAVVVTIARDAAARESAVRSTKRQCHRAFHVR